MREVLSPSAANGLSSHLDKTYIESFFNIAAGLKTSAFFQLTVSFLSESKKTAAESGPNTG